MNQNITSLRAACWAAENDLLYNALQALREIEATGYAGLFSRQQSKLEQALDILEALAGGRDTLGFAVKMSKVRELLNQVKKELEGPLWERL